MRSDSVTGTFGHRTWLYLFLFMSLWLAGCGGGGESASSGVAPVTLSFTVPAAKVASLDDAVLLPDEEAQLALAKNDNPLLYIGGRSLADLLIPDAQAAPPPAGVASVIVTISGPGMTSIVDNIPITPGVPVTRTYNVPVGPNVSFVIQAFDVNGNLLFAGTQLIANLQAGVPVTLNIPMAPAAGQDLIAPVITLVGITPVTVLLNSVYIDAGATALDNVDGNITARIVTVNPVNTAVLGTYTVSYNVRDAAGNPAIPVTRTVNVVATPPPADVTPPVITLLGANPATITQGMIYVDPGATAMDNVDGNITARIVTVNRVNTNIIGAYTVTYNVSDAAGNAAVQKTRTVNVVAAVGPPPPPPPVLPGAVTGTVLDSTTNQPVTGATVDLRLGANAPLANPVVGSGLTNATGVYTINNIPAGTYTATATANGYGEVGATVIITAGATTNAPAMLLPPLPAVVGAVTGTVVDATTNQLITGATVDARLGAGVTTGPIAGTATTGVNGSYTINNLAVGTYTLTVTATGYAQSNAPAVVTAGATTNVNVIPLSPLQLAGQARIVLTWGATPGDLDAHLIGPDPQAGRFHVYFGNQGSSVASPFAVLDVDVINGFGPETVTISQQTPGVYSYHVHNFGGVATGTALSLSGATVNVYQGAAVAPAATFTVPAGGLVGNSWHVFDMDGTTGAITPVNTIQDAVTSLVRVVLTPAISTAVTGSTTQFTVRGDSASASTIQLTGVTWTSSNPAVATVSATGLTTNLTAGTTTITATHTLSGYSDSSVLTVGANLAPAPTAPAITTTGTTPGNSQITHNDPNAGDTHTYAITTQPVFGTATVSTTGLVTYTPTISAAASDSITVTVTDSGSLNAPVTINVTVNAVIVASAGKFLYVNDKNPQQPAGNTISAFSINQTTGALTPIAGSPFLTGSLSLTGGYFGSNRIAVSPARNLLFATNQGTVTPVAAGGDNTISVFSINPATGALTPVAGSPFANQAGAKMGSGGMVTVNNAGTLLFVGNDNTGNISVFSIAASGTLTAVPGSPFANGLGLTTIKKGVNGLNLSADETQLTVGTSSAGRVIVRFNIAGNGVLTPNVGNPFPYFGAIVASPTSVTSNTAGIEVVAGTGGRLESFINNTSTGSTLDVGAANNQSVTFTPDGTRVITSGGTSSTLSVVDVSPAGLLTMNPGSPVALQANAFVKGYVAIHPNGLWVYATEAGQVEGFTMDATGAMISMGLPWPVAATSGNSIAIY